MSIAHTFNDKKRTEDVLISEAVDFSGLLLSTPVLNGLTDAGFQKPSPIQLKAIPLGRCGLDLIVQAKSGTGKTCVFTVVALESVDVSAVCIQVLVLAPTREIASQVQEVVRTVGSQMTGLKCHTFIGGLPVLQDKILAKNCHIAVGTPGRVKQLVEMGALKTNSIRLFVLDEADKLLEGDFQEPINWIYSTLPENKQILALSATYPEYLAHHLTAYMRNPTFVRLNITDPALIGIKQYHVVVPNHPMPNIVFNSKTEVIVKILSTATFQQCLIFSNMQTRALNLQSELQSRNWPTACIAGCLDQKERNFAMEQLKTYKCRILISTDLTSRGIDADKVNLVINLDVPFDHETYLHRIGRAGRFGSYGAAVTIVSAGGQDKELWAVEKKCRTHIPKLPDPIPKDLVTKEISVSIEDVVSTEKIINQPERENSSTFTASQSTPSLSVTTDNSSDKANDTNQQITSMVEPESVTSSQPNPSLFVKSENSLDESNDRRQQVTIGDPKSGIVEFVHSASEEPCNDVDGNLVDDQRTFTFNTCPSDCNDIQAEMSKTDINKVSAGGAGDCCLYGNGANNQNLIDTQTQNIGECTDSRVKDPERSGHEVNESSLHSMLKNVEGAIVSDIINPDDIQLSEQNSHCDKILENTQSAIEDIGAENIIANDCNNGSKDSEMPKDGANQSNSSAESQDAGVKSLEYVLRATYISENIDISTSNSPLTGTTSENIVSYASNVSHEILSEAVAAGTKLGDMECKTLQVVSSKCSLGEEIRLSDVAAVDDLAEKRLEKASNLNPVNDNSLMDKSGKNQTDEELCSKLENVDAVLDPEPVSFLEPDSESVTKSIVVKQNVCTQINSVPGDVKLEKTMEEGKLIDEVKTSSGGSCTQILSKDLNSNAADTTVHSPAAQSRVLAKPRRRTPRSLAVSDFLHCFNDNSDSLNRIGSLEVDGKVTMQNVDSDKSLEITLHRQVGDQVLVKQAEGDCENSAVEADGCDCNPSSFIDSQTGQVADRNKEYRRLNDVNQEVVLDCEESTHKTLNTSRDESIKGKDNDVENANKNTSGDESITGRGDDKRLNDINQEVSLDREESAHKTQNTSGDESIKGKDDEIENANTQTISGEAGAKGPSEIRSDADRKKSSLDSENKVHVSDQCSFDHERFSKLDKSLLVNSLSSPLFTSCDGIKSAKFGDLVKDCEEFCSNFNPDISNGDIPSIPYFTRHTDEENCLNSEMVKDLYDLGVSAVKEMKCKFLEKLKAAEKDGGSQLSGDPSLGSKSDSDGSRKTSQKIEQPPPHKGKKKVSNNPRSNSDDSNNERQKQEKFQHRNVSRPKGKQKTSRSFEDELQQYQQERGIDARGKNKRGPKMREPRASDSLNWRSGHSNDDSGSERASKVSNTNSDMKSKVKQPKSQVQGNEVLGKNVEKKASKNPKTKELSRRDVELSEKEHGETEKNVEECLQLDEMHARMLQKRQARKSEQRKNENEGKDKNCKTFNESRTDPAESCEVIEKQKENEKGVDIEKKDKECKQLDDMHSNMMAKRKQIKGGMSDNQNSIKCEDSANINIENPKQPVVLSETVKEAKSEICSNNSPDKKVKDIKESETLSKQVTKTVESMHGTNNSLVGFIAEGQGYKKDFKEKEQASLSLAVASKGFSSQYNGQLSGEDYGKEGQDIKSKQLFKLNENWGKPVKPSKSEARLAGLDVSDGSTSSTSSDISFSSTSAISLSNSSDLENKNMSKSQWYANRYADEEESYLKNKSNQRREKRAKPDKNSKNVQSFKQHNGDLNGNGKDGKLSYSNVDELNLQYPITSVSPYAHQYPLSYPTDGCRGYSPSIKYLSDHPKSKELPSVLKKPTGENKSQLSRSKALSQLPAFYNSSSHQNMHHGFNPYSSLASTNSLSHMEKIRGKQELEKSHKTVPRSKHRGSSSRKLKELKTKGKKALPKETVPDLSEESSGSESEDEYSSSHPWDYRTHLFQVQAHLCQHCVHNPPDPQSYHCHPYQYPSSGTWPSTSYPPYWPQLPPPQYYHQTPFWNYQQLQPSFFSPPFPVPPVTYPQYHSYYHNGWDQFPTPSQQYLTTSSVVYPHQISPQQSSLLQSRYVTYMSKQLVDLSKKYGCLKNCCEE